MLKKIRKVFRRKSSGALSEIIISQKKNDGPDKNDQLNKIISPAKKSLPG
jgi:hypothetical protein